MVNFRRLLIGEVISTRNYIGLPLNPLKPTNVLTKPTAKGKLISKT